jgi:DNA-binding transcriptional LysR family regulator
VGIYGDLPQEMRSRQLLTDRFVCVVRRGHPALGKRFTLDQFVAYPHLQVAPRGKPGGYIDDVLRERGRTRTVARAVPYFLTALQLLAQTDYVLTISERLAQRFAGPLALEVLEVPLKLRPYALSLLWHPRVDADEAHRLLARGVRARRTRGRRRAARGAAHPPGHLGPHLWPDAQAAQAQGPDSCTACN